MLTLVVGGRGPAVVLPEHDVQRLQRSQLVLVASATARGRYRGRGVPSLSTPAASSKTLLSAGTRGQWLFRPAVTMVSNMY